MSTCTEHTSKTQFFITVTDQISSISSCCHFLKCHAILISCEQISCCLDKSQCHPYSAPPHPQTPTFLKAGPASFFVSNGVQKLLAPFRPCPSHHPAWINVCVDVIALGWKELASNDAKKKKKFPSYSTCTYNEMICIILTRVYYCWGLPSSFEGYFVLPAAISWNVITRLIYRIWWCVESMHRDAREHHLN